MNRVITTVKEGMRFFNEEEHKQIKRLKEFMSKATSVETWNELREQASTQWDEKIVTAVDGLHKWEIQYDKNTKRRVLLGVKFN